MRSVLPAGANPSGACTVDEQIEVLGRKPKGLQLLPQFVTARDHDEIHAWLEAEVRWSGRGLREIPPYQGYPNRETPLPDWARRLGERLHAMRIFQDLPNQIWVLRYKTGIGTYFHIDKDWTGDVIAGLTVRSTRVLELIPLRGSRRVRVLLHPGDLYVLSGETRHRWKHGIPFTARDQFRGITYERTDGYSVTWRCLNSPGKHGRASNASWLRTVARALIRR
jgi:hypothetical protein